MSTVALCSSVRQEEGQSDCYVSSLEISSLVFDGVGKGRPRTAVLPIRVLRLNVVSAKEAREVILIIIIFVILVNIIV